MRARSAPGNISDGFVAGRDGSDRDVRSLVTPVAPTVYLVGDFQEEEVVATGASARIFTAAIRLALHREKAHLAQVILALFC